MKKKLFSLLLAVVIIPCSLFSGCFNKDDGDPKEMKEVTNYSEVDVVLSKLSQNRSNLKQFNVSGTKVVKNMYQGDTTVYNTNLVGAANYETNRYVLKATEDENVYIRQVQKENDDYVAYDYSSVVWSSGERHDNYSKSYVSKKYAENQLFYYDGVGVNIEDLDLSSYENLKESYKSLSKENFMLMSDYYHFYFELDPVIKLSKNGNDEYLFEYKVETDMFKGEGLSNTIIDASIKFSEDAVIQVKTTYKFVYTSLNQTECTMEMNYSSGFDSSILINDFSNFTGNVEPQDFDVNQIVDGFYDEWDTEDYVYSKDEIFTMKYENEVENTSIEWYLDAGYTKSLDTLTEYPSYFFVPYGKTVPNNGYGVVIKYGYVKGEDGKRHYVKETKEAIQAGDIYNLPTSIGAKSACYRDVCSMHEGDVTYTTVNGEVYNGSSITIENGKRYVIYQEADKVKKFTIR